MENVYVTAGRRVKAIRLKRGLTQAVLSERAGVTPSWVSCVEAGKEKGSLETYHRLATALGVPLSEIFKDAPVSGLTPWKEHVVSLKDFSIGERKVLYRLIKTFKVRGKP